MIGDICQTILIDFLTFFFINAIMAEKEKETVTTSITISKDVNEAIQKDAEQRDRSKNYIINDVLKNHYFPKEKSKKKSD
jgi:hypothetical protein